MEIWLSPNLPDQTELDSEIKDLENCALSIVEIIAVPSKVNKDNLLIDLFSFFKERDNADDHKFLTVLRDLHESFEHVVGSNSSGWINENKKELERFILKNFQLETKLLDSFCLNVKTFEKSKDTFLPEDAQQQMVKLKKFKALFNASQQANINKLILRVNQKEQGCVTRMEGYLRNLNDFSNLMACVQDAAGFLEMFIQKPDDRYRPLYHQRTRQLRNFWHTI